MNTCCGLYSYEALQTRLAENSLAWQRTVSPETVWSTYRVP